MTKKKNDKEFLNGVSVEEPVLHMFRAEPVIEINSVFVPVEDNRY